MMQDQRSGECPRASSHGKLDDDNMATLCWDVMYENLLSCLSKTHQMDSRVLNFSVKKSVGPLNLFVSYQFTTLSNKFPFTFMSYSISGADWLVFTRLAEGFPPTTCMQAIACRHLSFPNYMTFYSKNNWSEKKVGHLVYIKRGKTGGKNGFFKHGSNASVAELLTIRVCIHVCVIPKGL